MRWALVLLAALSGWIAAPAWAAGDGIAMTGTWHARGAAGAHGATGPVRWQAFDPARQRAFGRPPGGVVVQLLPRSGAWPDGPLVLAIPSPGFQRFTLQRPGVPPQRAHLLEAGAGRWPGHGRVAFDIPEPPPAGVPLRLHIDARDAIASPLTFELRRVPDHLKDDARWLAFASACLTTMVATALIALFFGLRLRDGAFVLYSVYVLSYAVIQAAQTGYLLHPLEWERAAATLPVWGRAATTASVVAAVLFFDRFAPLREWLPSMRRWLRLYCGVMLVLVVAGYVPGLQAGVRQLINPMLILGGPLLLGTAVATAWRGSRYAAIFLVGWAPLLAITVLGSLQLYGIAESWAWTDDAALAAGAFEAIVLTLGLAERAAAVRRQRDQARALAELDPLTEVLNRRAWLQRVQALVGGRQDLSVLFLDLDRFKLINDRLGHEGGDRVLKLFVEVLRRVLRAHDVVGRYGGEEFVVALPGTGTAQAAMVADRIRAELGATAVQPGAGLVPTVSAGVATLGAGESIEDLLRRADRALYAAKDGGRDRTVVD